MKKWMTAVAALAIAGSALAADWTFSGQDYPPYQWAAAGVVQGLFPEVTAQVCQKINVNCVFRIVPLKRALLELESGESDGVLSVLQTPERDTFAFFTAPVAHTSKSYFGLKSHVGKLTTLDDIKGATVGSVRGSSSSKLAAKHKAQLGRLTTQEENNNEVVLNKLSKLRYGETGLALGNEDVLNYLIKKGNLNNLEKLLFVQRDEYQIGFSRKRLNEAAVKNFNQVLVELQNSGALDAIYMKYGVAKPPFK